ncbi:MAG TPA: hypothetical protein VEQ59_25345 [Polyangiaceae bacterium]|nr:hypothetical protein [Polyangiaceae bacterium]
MLRWPSLISSALSLSIGCWSVVASAQADGAPLPDAPVPPPAPIAPEAAPPAPSEPAAPPATSPPSAAPPASDAFPLPPSPPPAGAAQKPSAPLSPTPAASSPAPAPPRSEQPASAPPRPSDGLFEQKPRAEPVRHHDDDDGGTDQFKIGPVVGVGVPSVISFGGTLKLTRFLGAGVNVGLIPKVRLNYYGDATLSYQHYDIYGRIYPFGGGFFLSGGAGYATVKGSLDTSQTQSFNGVSGTVNYTGEGSVRTLMLTTLIGYFYTTSIGFSIGVDAGAQIPIAPSQIEFSRTFSVNPRPPILTDAQISSAAGPYLTKSDKSVRDSLEKIGRTVLPTVNLRIGWIL